ncbi:hypothetical protein Cantr_03586 [Candida viswanathii]|uniref:Mitochondrial resolvase Ydc2 catalytic domain-containing protein n=1 Tax=Candida viswanathii TaxID=5486 RepID=A0A367YNJ8_9ASCO|nr:hypothetical protein Cantr_03586 [Candida viswanathii]
MQFKQIIIAVTASVAAVSAANNSSSTNGAAQNAAQLGCCWCVGAIAAGAISVGYRHRGQELFYCKSTRPLDKSFPIRITECSKVNLDEMFGNYEPLLNRDSQIDAKRYFQFITRALLEHLEPHKSDVVVMEAQRTRSIGNTSTLPSVMQCYTLENLIVGNTYPRIVIPMTAFQMMNYWVHRFFGKSTVKSVTKNQKAIRFDLLSTWKDVLFELPGYGGAELEKKQVLEYLKLEKGEKVDDLMDSLLYNITINSQFQNLRELHELMSTDLAGVTWSGLLMTRMPII